MTLTFYFAPNSTANITAAILAELEHDQPNPIAQRIELSIPAGDTRKPDFLSTINPNGRVPALVHDGVPLWESSALTMYLGETFGVDRSLYPALGPQRGEAMKWIVWASTTLWAVAPQLRASVPAGGAGEGEGVKKAIAQTVGVLDAALEGREYLLGDRYCLADTHLWTLVAWFAGMGVGMAEYVNVRRWLDKVGARPALKALGG